MKRGRCQDNEQSTLVKSEFRENDIIPNSKFHGANMGPIWGRQDPGGPHVGPMNFAIWDYSSMAPKLNMVLSIYDRRLILNKTPSNELLALCEGNTPVSGGFPHKGQ